MPVGKRTLGSISKIYAALPRQMGGNKSAPQTTGRLCSSCMQVFPFIIMLKNQALHTSSSARGGVKLVQPDFDVLQ